MTFFSTAARTPGPISLRNATAILVLGLTALLVLGGCSKKAPNERVTGNGGSVLLRTSSTQITVDLTDEEKETLKQIQDHRFAGAKADAVLAAGAASLEAMEFKPVVTDTDMMRIEGQQDKILGERWRKVIRAVLKSRGLPLSAKPDHESVSALIQIKPGSGTEPPLARARFNVTTWDSNGDSRTVTILDRNFYDDFFKRMETAVAQGDATAPAPPAPR
ncbi:MAG: hypothetical protein F8N37_07035 [Telmatospirillum sp.]|nr:hypothetical protein [Telmatospirillum sp.]